MKHSATSFDRIAHDVADAIGGGITEHETEVDPVEAPVAGTTATRASRSLPEPALAYFPNVRSTHSGRDLGARARRRIRCGGVTVTNDPGRFGHIPVLLDRCIDLLAPAVLAVSDDGTGAVVIDATLGAGGHSEAILQRFSGVRVIGLDRDPSALEIASDRLAPFGDRFTAVYARYDEIARALAESGYPATNSVDGILFDLGVSSMQLDRTERGFAYSVDAPLDMRMDYRLSLTAADILNSYEQGEIAAILREFGEEKFAGRIAAAVVRRRRTVPFRTTGELVELLYQAIPAPARRTGGHPAKRTFQALRVAVNGELDSLRAALPAALAATRPGGRVVVMAYQSLEDRIVKNAFAAATANRTPEGLPMELPGYGPEFTTLTRGAERADAAEIERNPRSAPVRLRAVARLTDEERS
ncbi:ribosomal RNA small subunit methyltransferase H [Mycolicibacterium insubricum]|nr:16S rRNA (cytosine(1402)-N(4))-methyltransferase RsmH [Mycolicibacterium sp.]MCV7081737.1 16S rRNA (cytosine(1402)-N(4))-methyltransferase RsmH [Mycolicibacterium insubricum]BBZ67686.1 ribosomal RNA small subunit methyltransferase H [Mycolicibacterium insubricum]